MPFKYDFSDDLESTLSKLLKKDRKCYEILLKKIEEISNCDEATIGHFKNLRHGLSEYKRVHITKSFVLLFKVFKNEKFILFDKFKHHDEAYVR